MDHQSTDSLYSSLLIISGALDYINRDNSTSLHIVRWPHEWIRHLEVSVTMDNVRYSIESEIFFSHNFSELSAESLVGLWIYDFKSNLFITIYVVIQLTFSAGILWKINLHQCFSESNTSNPFIFLSIIEITMEFIYVVFLTRTVF